MKKALLLFVLAFSVKSNIQILSPDSLKEQISFNEVPGDMEYNLSEFGNIPYTAMETVLVLVPPENNIDGCNTLAKPENLEKDQKFVWLMVRGSCKYHDKEQKARESGAYAILLYDDLELVNISNVGINYGDSVSSSDIDKLIPIILIKKDDAENIKKALGGAEEVLIQIDFDLEEEKTDVVIMQYWINPAYDEAYQLLLQLKDDIVNLDDKLVFQPLYLFENADGRDSNRNNCYGDGKYCFTPLPKNNYEYSSVLDEAIRQKCLYEELYENRSNPSMWWNYIAKYTELLSNLQTNKEPVKLDFFNTIVSDINLEDEKVSLINKCYEDSFESMIDKKEEDNKILRNDLELKSKEVQYKIPAIFLNNRFFKQNFSPKIILSAICDQLSTMPKVCDVFYTSNITWKTNNQKSTYRLALAVIAILFICLIIIFFVMIFIRRQGNRKIEDDIRENIRKHVIEYMKHKDSRIDA